MDWSERESEVLKQLADDNGMGEDSVLRQALRLFQLADSYFKKGYELAFWHADEGIVRPLHDPSKKRPWTRNDAGF